MANPSRRPTREEILAAAGKTVPDVIAPNLKVLFCGINPGLYTAVIGHHFGRPGNRFWPALHTAGITPRLLSPYEERELLDHGYGITNLVARATATADELSNQELIEGGQALVEKIRRYRPRFLGVLGLTAYRTAFGRPQTKIGLQAERFAAAPDFPGARLWVLPNPSGLNAHYQLAGLARLFRALKEAADAEAAEQLA
jgi:double-stranded uracil-DNA glycosylase